MPSDKVQRMADDIKKLPPAGIAIVKMALADTPERKAEAVEEAKAVLDMQTPGWNDKTRLIEGVRTFDHELRDHNQRIKTLNEQMQEIVESTDEHAVVESLKKQLKAAQEKLKYRLLGNNHYNDLAEKLADEKHQKQEAEVEISDFLIAYHADTREQQIELEAGDAREVLLKAKLGKPKEFQLNLLTQGGE